MSCDSIVNLFPETFNDTIFFIQFQVLGFSSLIYYGFTEAFPARTFQSVETVFVWRTDFYISGTCEVSLQLYWTFWRTEAKSSTVKWVMHECARLFDLLLEDLCHLHFQTQEHISKNMSLFVKTSFSFAFQKIKMQKIWFFSSFLHNNYHELCFVLFCFLYL